MFFERIKELFEDTKVFGFDTSEIIEKNSIILDALSNDILSDSMSIEYGTIINSLYKLILNKFSVVVHQMSEDYEVDVEEALSKFMTRLTWDLEDYSEGMKGHIKVFEDSKIDEFREGILDSLDEKQWYRAVFFLSALMIKKRIDKDISGGYIS